VDGRVKRFSSESEAIDRVIELLAPFTIEVRREIELDSGLRFDLGVLLTNNEWAPIEVKPFDDPPNQAALLDAITQAASYADEMQYPVFIGPIVGKPLELSNGVSDNRVAQAHLLAGRMNVGFVYERPVTGSGVQGGLMLRGQNLVGWDGKETRFSQLFQKINRYRVKRGSQWLST
jgi:hypothetical protein